MSEKHFGLESSNIRRTKPVPHSGTAKDATLSPISCSGVKPDSFSGREQAECFRIVKRNRLNVDTGNIFQHTNNCRIIMAQYIKLRHTTFKGVIIEVSRNDATVFFYWPDIAPV